MKIFEEKRINAFLYFRALIVKLYRFQRPFISDDCYDMQGEFLELIPKNSLIVKKDNILVIDNPDLFWA